VLQIPVVTDEIFMAKYKVVINRNRCVDCGISTGQCPTHAKTLSQLLSQNRKGVSVGVFSEDIYERVKRLAEACPAKAIIIKKIA
jgi:ferredoxin